MSGDDARPVHIRRQGFGPAEELRSAGTLSKITIGTGAGAESSWLAAGYAVVRQVLGDHRRFSNRRRWHDRS